MTTIRIYKNLRNGNKYLEVHNDGHYHNTVRQYIETNTYCKGRKMGVVKNYNGDGCLHRWRKENLEELLTDYICCAIMMK